MSKRPKYRGEPTLAQVMRRPKWILALLLALLVAAGFAGLAQWQMDHAITVQSQEAEDTETPQPLSDLTAAGAPVTERSAGKVATFDARVERADTLVVGNRMNQGALGYWVVSHVVTDSGSGGHLAVALGWAENRDAAESIAQELRSGVVPESLAEGTAAETWSFTGRYMPSEGPELPEPEADLTDVGTLSTAHLVNLWAPFEGAAYPGFIVSHESFPGLELIDSFPPLPEETINWLNLFYAIEWVVFAGFAIFFWYRLARDAWEKEHELLLLRAETRAAAAATPAPAATQHQ